jgi:hypothetical protein
MAIPFACPYCGATGSAQDDGGGRVVRCPQCQKWIQLPSLSSEAPPSRSPAVVPPAPVSASAPAPWYGDQDDDRRDRGRANNDGDSEGDRDERRPPLRRDEPDDFDFLPESRTGDGLPRRVEVAREVPRGQWIRG